MKKVNKDSRVNDLVIDVIEYAFTEWLVRQGAFSAFKANYEFIHSFRGSFRDQLRFHIQLTLDCPSLGPGYLISSAFPFFRTPEGVDFWSDKSDAWKRFCTKLYIQS